MMKEVESDIAYLLSLLIVLVYRNGGKLVIENSDEIAGKALTLETELDAEKDRATLTVYEAPDQLS